MKETLYIENMNGQKSYYDVEIISKSIDGKEVVIKEWNGEKTLKLDEKRKVYVSND
jgi:hypothetical protein